MMLMFTWVWFAEGRVWVCSIWGIVWPCTLVHGLDTHIWEWPYHPLGWYGWGRLGCRKWSNVLHRHELWASCMDHASLSVPFSLRISTQDVFERPLSRSLFILLTLYPWRYIRIQSWLSRTTSEIVPLKDRICFSDFWSTIVFIDSFVKICGFSLVRDWTLLGRSRSDFDKSGQNISG